MLFCAFPSDPSVSGGDEWPEPTGAPFPCLIHHWGYPGPSEISWNITCLWSYWFSPPHLCPFGSCTSHGVVGSWSRGACLEIPLQPRTCFPPAGTGLAEWVEIHHRSFQTYPGSSTVDNHKGWESEEHQARTLDGKTGQRLRAAASVDGSKVRRLINLPFA